MTFDPSTSHTEFPHDKCHCVKSVHIRSYSIPCPVRMRENSDQNNSEYGHFLRSLYKGNFTIERFFL